MMYGQMTAGSWIYIGTQGIVQGTFETFAEMGRQHYGGDLAGKWILTAGLGGMGGAQPLAAVMAGAHCIAIEVQESSIEKRLETRYLDHRATSIDEALDIIAHRHRADQRRPARQRRRNPPRDGRARHPPRRGHRPDQRPRPRQRLLPGRLERRQMDRDARTRPRRRRRRRPRTRWPHMSRRCSPSRNWACRPSIMATTSARKPSTPASPTPSTSPASSPPTSGRLFCRGIGPFRWVALSRRSRGHLQDRPAREGADPRRSRTSTAGSTWRATASPSRACPRASAGSASASATASASPSTRWSRNGEVSAPIVIGRDHLDSGSVASPNRETESMQDGSDAVSDWPLLNALLNTASGATWVSLHHGGGVGMGYSQHAGMVIVADGTDDAARRLERVLWNDPATGVMRHADAGYDDAVDCAREQGLDLPMVDAMKLNPESIDLATLRQLWAGAPASPRRRRAAARRRRRRLDRPHRRRGETVYGVNTGFGSLANTRIPDDRLAELQRNLILVAQRGPRRAAAAPRHPPDDRPQAARPRPRLLRRPPADHRRAARPARPRRDAADPEPGQRRRVGRPRPARASHRRADGPRQHRRRRHNHARRRRAAETRTWSRSSSAPRKAWR